MPDYIEREALQENFIEHMQNDRMACPIIKTLEVLEIIENQPTADVVPVVRCKDCIWSYKNTFNGRFGCHCLNIYVNENDYCCYGKRKENNAK